MQISQNYCSAKKKLWVCLLIDIVTRENIRHSVDNAYDVQEYNSAET